MREVTARILLFTGDRRCGLNPNLFKPLNVNIRYLGRMQGRTVNFRNTLLIMTSNVGSKSILGDGQTYTDMQVKVKQALQNQYRPEFLNRLDEIIVFRPLAMEESRQIADILLSNTQQRAKDQDIHLEVHNAIFIKDHDYIRKFTCYS